MFFHIFKYQLRLRFKDKLGTFWAIAFPIILAILFNLAFANLLEGEEFKKIDIAVVSTSKETTDFHTALDESDLFNIKVVNKSDAKDLLSTGKISGFINEGEDITITLAKSGINQSILKEFVDTYSERTSTISNIIEENPEALQNGFIENMDVYKDYIKEQPLGSSTNIAVVFFYTLIAMVTLLGANFGSDDIMNIQGNQSPRAARINVAPENKLKVFFPTLCATMVFHFSVVLIYILFVNKVLKIDFGSSLSHVILLAFVGSFTGIAMGTMISSLINKKQSVKTAIILVTTMFGSFLSGMMAVQIKYWVQKYIPIVSYINPANLITDGLYSLYYYDTLERYFLNLSILGAFGVVFILITYLVLRRQQYASI